MRYDKWVSHRVSELTPSATLRINALAKEYQAQGKPVLSFATGEPDFPTPAGIMQGAVQALEEGKTKYTPTPGIPQLRQAIADRYREQYALSYEPAQVVVTVGGKQAVYNLFQSILDPGDEVIIFAPYWVSYPEMIRLAGGKPIVVQTTIDNGFAPVSQEVAEAISSRTKAILINSPNNPTGAVYDSAILESLAQLAVANDLLIISDEIYEDLVYQGTHTCLASLGPEVQERTVVISGVSKSFSMTGWRVGWAVGPEPIIKGMSDIQSHATSNTATVSQYAALAALTKDFPEPGEMLTAFRERRELMCSALTAIPGFALSLPQGAFYLFIKIEDLPGFTTSEEFCRNLLSEGLVAAVPGEAFGVPGHIRLSYAASVQDIEEGCRRIDTFVGRYFG